MDRDWRNDDDDDDDDDDDGRGRLPTGNVRRQKQNGRYSTVLVKDWTMSFKKRTREGNGRALALITMQEDDTERRSATT